MFVCCCFFVWPLNEMAVTTWCIFQPKQMSTFSALQSTQWATAHSIIPHLSLHGRGHCPTLWQCCPTSRWHGENTCANNMKRSSRAIYEEEVLGERFQGSDNLFLTGLIFKLAPSCLTYIFYSHNHCEFPQLKVIWLASLTEQETGG